MDVDDLDVEVVFTLGLEKLHPFVVGATRLETKTCS